MQFRSDTLGYLSASRQQGFADEASFLHGSLCALMAAYRFMQLSLAGFMLLIVTYSRAPLVSGLNKKPVHHFYEHSPQIDHVW